MNSDRLAGTGRAWRGAIELAKAASSAELRDALESHLAETEGHVTRLEQAFDMLDETAKTKTCAGMLGIVEEGSDLIKETAEGSALDAGIIAGAQRPRPSRKRRPRTPG